MIPTLIVALVIVGLVVAGMIQNSKKNERLEGFAQRYGFGLVPATWLQRANLTGNYRGADVSVREELRGNGRHSQTFSIFSTPLRTNVPPNLVMFHEGVIARVGKLLGWEDIQVGFKELDDSFIIRGAEEPDVKAFLARPGVGETLLSLYRTCKKTRIEDGTLSIEILGSMSDTIRLQHYLDKLVECSQVLEGHCTDPGQVPPPEPVLDVGTVQAPHQIPSEPLNVEDLFPEPKAPAQAATPIGVPVEGPASRVDNDNSW